MNIFDFKLIKKKLSNKIKQAFFHKNMKKSVEHGANGTMRYVLKSQIQKDDK